MSITKCWQIIDNLPSPPDHLVQEALDAAHEYHRRWYDPDNRPPVVNSGGNGIVFGTKIVYDNDGNAIVTRSNPRFPLSEEWNTWVRENIAPVVVESGVSVGLMPRATDEETTMGGPHTDTTRNFALLYPIEKGNDDQWTEFYQEAGEDVYRPYNCRPTQLAKLTCIDRVNAPLHKWTMIDGRILHAQKNIHKSRICLQVSLATDPFGVFDRAVVD
jgi:hypothetical protein